MFHLHPAKLYAVEWHFYANYAGQGLAGHINLYCILNFSLVLPSAWSKDAFTGFTYCLCAQEKLVSALYVCTLHFYDNNASISKLM